LDHGVVDQGAGEAGAGVVAAVLCAAGEAVVAGGGVGAGGDCGLDVVVGVGGAVAHFWWGHRGCGVVCGELGVGGSVGGLSGCGGGGVCGLGFFGVGG